MISQLTTASRDDDLTVAALDGADGAPVPWDRLTVQPRKRDLFALDFVADEAWIDIHRMLGGQALPALLNYTYLLIKPEATVRRCTDAVLRYLARHEFTPVAIRPLAVNRNASHHVWRYQWNAATCDRVRLTTFVNDRCRSLLILLRDDSASRIPASVRLWELKGSAHEARRTAGHLRSVVRMHNRMLGFVHTPDEPADLLREFGILLDDCDRQFLLKAILSDQRYQRHDHCDELHAEALRFEAGHAAHAVSPSEAAARLLAAGSDPVLQVVDAMRRRVNLPLAEVRSAFGQLDDDARRWDFITIAAEVIAHDRHGVAPIIESKAVAEVTKMWTRYAPVVV